MPNKLQIETPWFPDATTTEMDFLDSSFFATKPGQKSLPTPTEVTTRSKDIKSTPRPAPVKFENLNLIVKFGSRVVVEEALCLRMLQKILSDKVPVPEVYGWKVEGHYVFIYMELIRGESLYNLTTATGRKAQALYELVDRSGGEEEKISSPLSLYLMGRWPERSAPLGAECLRLRADAMADTANRKY
jgi:hypothetical protein